MRYSSPRKAAAARNITQFVDRNSRSRSRCRSTIGRLVRSSTRTNVTSSAAPRTQVVMTPAAEHEAGHVEAAGIDGVDLLQDERAEDHRHDADGHVDEEHPAPREVGDQEA